MEKKSDRRIRRTKALLRHGLAQLMSEKSVNEVTVKELVDLVDINRSTFYLHYTDIYNMLESVEDELFDEILHTIRSVHSTKTVFLSSRISLPFCSTTGKSVPPCWAPTGTSAFCTASRRCFLSTAWLPCAKLFPSGWTI